MAKHGVVASRSYVTGMYNPVGAIYSIKFAEDTDNGCVLELKDRLENDRETYNVAVPTGETKKENVVIVTTPEVDPDERHHDVWGEFYNKAGEIGRGDKLIKENTFDLSPECFDGVPAVGKFVNLQAKNKLLVAEESSDATVGKITMLINGCYEVTIL